MFNSFKKLFSSPPLTLTCAGLSDIGQVRKNNEDCFSILEGKNIFIVADGMGGHNGGEIASRAALEIMHRHFSDKTTAAMRQNAPEIRHAMITGFEKANNTVMALAEDDLSLQGMGCTLVLAFIDGAVLHTCHVGDARCYLLSKGRIKRITRDHTAVEESAVLRNRHVVTRVIGYPFPEPPEYNTATLREGDRVLLCSDGLWSMVDDRQIHRLIMAAQSPEQATEQLIKLANAAGGKDNITALTIFC